MRDCNRVVITRPSRGDLSNVAKGHRAKWLVMTKIRSSFHREGSPGTIVEVPGSVRSAF